MPHRRKTTGRDPSQLMRIITEHELWVFTAGAAIGSIVTYWIATRRTRFVSKVRRTIEILGDHQKFDQWFPGWRANISKIATHEEIAALRPWADKVSYHFYPWAERIRQMLGMPRKKSGILLYSEVIVAEEIICKNLLGLSVNSLDFLLREKTLEDIGRLLLAASCEKAIFDQIDKVVWPAIRNYSLEERGLSFAIRRHDDDVETSREHGGPHADRQPLPTSGATACTARSR
jgi:hypothetical protein